MELNEKFWELRDSVVQCELLILRQLNFHVSFEHPHKVIHVTAMLLHVFFSIKILFLDFYKKNSYLFCLN